MDEPHYTTVILLVNQIPLVTQQGGIFQDTLCPPYNLRVGMFWGEKNIRNWAHALKKYDVFVATAAFFLNALQKKRVDLQEFQLLVSTTLKF